MNQQKNVLIIITADGWCFMYSFNDSSVKESLTADGGLEQVLKLHYLYLSFHPV